MEGVVILDESFWFELLMRMGWQICSYLCVLGLYERIVCALPLTTTTF